MEKESNQLFNTIDFEAACKACETAQKHRLMIGLIGDTGTGKTTSVTEYAKRPNVVKVTYEKSMNPKLFFMKLLQEMRIDFEGSIYALINRAASGFNEMESPLLIVDEVGKMPYTLFLHLHDFREKTKETTGIVLAGMPYFKSNLQKYANKGKEGCSEFLRRINLWHTLEELKRSEIQNVCQANGIQSPERFYGKRRFGDLMNAICLEKILNQDV